MYVYEYKNVIFVNCLVILHTKRRPVYNSKIYFSDIHILPRICIETLWRRPSSTYAQSLFYSFYLTPFCCNPLHHFTPLLNLCSLVFCFTPLAVLFEFVKVRNFLWEYHLWFTPFLSMPTFFRKATRAWKKGWVCMWAHRSFNSVWIWACTYSSHFLFQSKRMSSSRNVGKSLIGTCIISHKTPPDGSCDSRGLQIS
jgi:hypothetical protein